MALGWPKPGGGVLLGPASPPPGAGLAPVPNKEPRPWGGSERLGTGGLANSDGAESPGSSRGTGLGRGIETRPSWKVGPWAVMLKPWLGAGLAPNEPLWWGALNPRPPKRLLL